MQEAILEAYLYADTLTKSRGLRWYQLAHNECKKIAETCELPLDKVCGVMSALSPSIKWEDNVEFCKILCLIYAGGRRGEAPVVPGFNGYKACLNKAWLILNNAYDTVADAFRWETGPKTTSFYYNLLDPADERHVTIDRHAACAAKSIVPTRQVAIKSNEYTEIAEHYRTVAASLGLVPCQLQAVVWLMQRHGYQLSLL